MQRQKVVLMCLPDTDFDVTESAVPWKILTRSQKIRVEFATEFGGKTPQCDPLLLTGVIFGKLGAESEAKEFYDEMTKDEHFRNPHSWKTLDFSAFDGLFLPGGHAQGMKQYLGSKDLQDKVTEFWKLGKPVASICHGPLVLARAGVLTGRKTSCLPFYMERLAYFSTFWKLGKYYRTYEEYVEDEIRRLMGGKDAQIETGTSWEFDRGTDSDDKPAMVVEDGNYLSARWPGDSYLLGKKFLELLEKN